MSERAELIRRLADTTATRAATGRAHRTACDQQNTVIAEAAAAGMPHDQICQIAACNEGRIEHALATRRAAA